MKPLAPDHWRGRADAGKLGLRFTHPAFFRIPNIMTQSPFKHLTVIGAGLIGGSFIMACRENFPALHIRAIDRDAETLQYAVRMGLSDEVSLHLPAEWEDEHLIVLAPHLMASLELLEQIAPRVAGRSIVVTDVGSCKRRICERGEELLPSQFIGGHPLAGKEFSGIRHATPLLFAGKPYALCPPGRLQTDETLQAAYDRLRRFISLGLRAKVRDIETGPHDRYMAYVSHLPQLYSIVLTNILYNHEPGRLLSWHGGGIDDQLRLAASPYEMWRDVFTLNRDNILAVVEELRGSFGQAEEILDKPAMATWFERSNTIHREFHERSFPEWET